MLLSFKSFLQASPINMDATGCEQAKEICCNVNVWSILVNVILQVTFVNINVNVILQVIGNNHNYQCHPPSLYHPNNYGSIIMILQDAPFFVFRVILITYFKLITSMNIFCTLKNTLVIALQVK